MPLPSLLVVDQFIVFPIFVVVVAEYHTTARNYLVMFTPHLLPPQTMQTTWRAAVDQVQCRLCGDLYPSNLWLGALAIFVTNFGSSLEYRFGNVPLRDLIRSRFQ
eukprot:gb/GECG01011670.1/.p1 GENE.gb/GECG01011670.1/~~gb/GECG01011670.1/.p1  ORF type:complete len:105 (+),score=4.37 gb/GECG01011670.1/:1-315(+)